MYLLINIQQQGLEYNNFYIALKNEGDKIPPFVTPLTIKEF